MDKCKIVTKTIDVLQERGWCQNALEDKEGRVCIRGAMNVVTTGNPILFPSGGPVYKEVEGEMKEFIPDEYHDDGAYDDTVVHFNNAEDTTKEDVLGVLQKTKEKVC